jgi:hypothetical protein
VSRAAREWAHAVALAVWCCALAAMIVLGVTRTPPWIALAGFVAGIVAGFTREGGMEVGAHARRDVCAATEHSVPVNRRRAPGARRGGAQ